MYVFCMSFKMRKIIYYDLDIVSIYHDSSQSISFVGWLFDIIVLLYTLIGLIARSVYIASNYYISLAVSSLCLIFFHPLNPKTKFRKIFYSLKQFFLLFSFVWIQFYLSLPSGKWVSSKTVWSRDCKINIFHCQIHNWYRWLRDITFLLTYLTVSIVTDDSEKNVV